MSKKDKQQAQPQIVVNITPMPLVDAPAYYVNRELSTEERATLRLTWLKMNEQEGTKRILLITPPGTSIETMQTPALQQLRRQIDEVLKERGEA